MEPTIVRVVGGLPGEPDNATVGELVLQRRPGETLDELERWAVDVAWGVEAAFVVVGGLPV